jgi:IS5 family transposase
VGLAGKEGQEVIRRHFAQRSVFEVLLPDGEKLWDPVLREIDRILDDEELVELVSDALASRRPRSRRFGRPGTPAEVVLRVLVLKHLQDWSFEDCEREIRGSLLWRAFCRIDCERVPDSKTLIRLSHLIGSESLKKAIARLVKIGVQRGVIRGGKLRVDTTVVETNVHYPTDSSLLADGVRVLSRTARKLFEVVGKSTVCLRNRMRSVNQRAFEIAHLSRRAMQEQVKARMQTLYRELIAITRAAVREAQSAARSAIRRAHDLPTSTRERARPLAERIRHVVDLVQRVIQQTRARVFKGNTKHPDKVLSLFETHTEAIRKGKASKPTEFGKLVKIQEAEAQFITDYHVCRTRVPDVDLWSPSLTVHKALFGRPPHLAVADSGFSSGANRRTATELGVRRVALPKSGALSKTQRAHQHQRWFRRALRWRTGSEGRISALKRRHGLDRCLYRGLHGVDRWVGLGVVANDLLALGRALQPPRRSA